MTSRTLPSVGLALLLLPFVGCDKATPVAPSGVVLTISATPGQVALNGSSIITVVGRKPDGQPLNPGTEIRFSTTIGSINPIIAEVKSGGTATTTFFADGRSGTATVTASTGTAGSTGSGSGSSGGSGGSAGSGGSGGSAGSGGSGGSGGNTNTGPQSGIESVSVSLVVGQDASTRPTLIISANPTTVGVNETSAITIIARNPDRSPVGAGQQILMTSTLGTLSPVRPLTRADGTATSILNAGKQSGTATIGAILGTSDQVTTQVIIREAGSAVSISTDVTSIPGTGGTVNVTASVINEQGLPVPGVPVTFTASAGTYGTTTGVQTDTQGLAKNVLTVTAAQLPASVVVVKITARIAGSSGFIESDPILITVLR